MTGKAILIRNIRAKRPKPGLAAQHLTAVQAVATLCSAEVSGLKIGSGEILFRPGRLRGGDFTFDVGTAGNVTLVLQAVLPAAIACSEPSHLSLTGGTDVKAAPPLDYFRYVLLPLLNRMTLQACITVQRRGYYPRGGGLIEVSINPARPLRPLCLETPGTLEEINGIVHIANHGARAFSLFSPHPQLPSHTTMWLLQQFLPGRFHSTRIGGLIQLNVTPS